MLCLVLALTAGMAVATSSPSPVPHEAAVEPLKEIGHVTATTSFCKAIVDHAVRAVTLGIDNDHRIDGVISTIRTTNFDADAVSKNRGLQQLSNQYATLAEQAVAAERAAKALRTDAHDAPTPEEAKDLTAFADALDGALHRQRTIARDLASMIAIFNVRPPMTEMEREELVIDAQRTEGYRFNVTYQPADERVPPLLSTVAKNAVDDFVDRRSGIAADELTAAKLVEPVFGGC